MIRLPTACLKRKSLDSLDQQPNRLTFVARVFSALSIFTLVPDRSSVMTTKVPLMTKVLYRAGPERVITSAIQHAANFAFHFFRVLACRLPFSESLRDNLRPLLHLFRIFTRM